MDIFGMDSNPNPVNTALSTLEVREMILKKLDIRSLANCRLVCQSWNVTASSVLEKMPVWIKRDWTSDDWIDLYKCMMETMESQIFPFTGLNLSLSSLSHCSRVNDENAVKFLNAFGHQFTHLRLSNSYRKYPDMVNSLLKKTPNVRFLEVMKLPQYVEQKESEEFSMSSLHIISVRNAEGDVDSLMKLILSAPQLVEIQNVNSSSAVQMEAIRATGKFSLVSSLTLTEDTEVPIYSELASNPPRLTALSVESKDCSRQFVTAVKVVLAESQHTLKKLEFHNFAVQLDAPPVFTSLEELGFKISFKDSYGSTPRAAVFPQFSSSLFPKLQKIRLDLIQSDEWGYGIQQSDIEKYFWKECEKPMESVDMLELGSYCGPYGMKYLARIFPGVTYVSINYKNGKYGFPRRPVGNIWCLEEFPCLSKLVIRDFPFKYGLLDTVLTGIPTEIIPALQVVPKKTIPPELEEILRPHGSIVQLKNLKELTITTTSSSSCRPTAENPFMTMLSIWYALELIPGLRTSILYCCKKIGGAHDYFEDLEEGPATDYVTIGRCHCRD